MKTRKEQVTDAVLDLGAAKMRLVMAAVAKEQAERTFAEAETNWAQCFKALADLAAEPCMSAEKQETR